MFEVINFIDRKKAGMSALLGESIVPTMVGEAKNKAYWKDQTTHARGGLNGGCEGGNGKYTIYLAHGVSYGEILEKGSKPHDIHFGKRTFHHPGTKAMPILEDTLMNNKQIITDAIKEYWSD